MLHGKAKPIIWGIIIGSFICFLLLITFSFIFVKIKSIPENFISILTFCCILFSSFFSGFISSRISKKNGIFYGGLTGFILFLMIFISGVLIFGENLSFITLTKSLSMILSGSIGGVIGVNKRVHT